MAHIPKLTKASLTKLLAKSIRSLSENSLSLGMVSRTVRPVLASYLFSAFSIADKRVVRSRKSRGA